MIPPSTRAILARCAGRARSSQDRVSELLREFRSEVANVQAHLDDVEAACLADDLHSDPSRPADKS